MVLDYNGRTIGLGDIYLVCGRVRAIDSPRSGLILTAPGGQGIHCHADEVIHIDDALAGGGGGGDNISVNGVAATNADFDDATPAPPAASLNVRWQKDTASPNNISANVPHAGAAQAGVVTTAAQSFAGPKTLIDPATFLSYFDMAAISAPGAPPALRGRIYALEQNGRIVFEYITPSGVVFRFNRDNVFIAKVDEAGGVAPGNVVYISGATGANEQIRKWIADGSLTRDLIGLTIETAAFNAFTFVMTLGKIGGINTSGIAEGLQAYASATVAGAFTGTEPAHPNLRAEIGTVTRSHMTQGEIVVVPLVVRGDFVGTRRNQWLVGDNAAGAKDIVLRNGFDMTVRGNPTAARLITLPDADVTLENTGHGSKHQQGGSDAIKLDDLATPDDNTDLDASITRHGLLRKLPGGTTTFLRADGAFAAPPGGAGASATTVEVDLGATPAFTGKFTITDVAISPTSKLLVWQAPGPYTGKGTLADEAEMQPVDVVTVAPASGSAVVRWQTPPMMSLRERPSIAAGTATTTFPKDPQAIVRGNPRRSGRARGNVKFNYMVL